MVRSPQRRAAMIASLIWTAAVVAYAAGFIVVSSGAQPRGTVVLDGLFFVVALILPLMFIWLVAWLSEELELQRAITHELLSQFAPLLNGLEVTRAVLETHGPASPRQIDAAIRVAVRDERGPDLQTPIERLIKGQAELQAAVALMARSASGPMGARPLDLGRKPRPGGKGTAARPQDPALSEEEQPVEEAESVPAQTGIDARPAWADLIRALDFPKDASDHDGFRALKAALRHPNLAQMLQAAEDVLTLLSQRGVYMEDLEVEPGDPAAWQRFIDGARGPEVMGLGGIADEKALGLAKSLRDDDPIFRDTADHFQKRFTLVLSDYGAGATDARLLEMLETRSGRAFQLLGRLNGLFDPPLP